MQVSTFSRYQHLSVSTVPTGSTRSHKFHAASSGYYAEVALANYNDAHMFLSTGMK